MTITVSKTATAIRQALPKSWRVVEGEEMLFVFRNKKDADRDREALLIRLVTGDGYSELERGKEFDSAKQVVPAIIRALRAIGYSAVSTYFLT